MANEADQYLESLNAQEFPVQEITEEQKRVDPSTLSYDERMQKLRRTVQRQPLHREILYQILVYAQQMRTLRELEDFIAELPQFQEATQPQYYLVQFLVDAGGLDQLDLDADGRVIQASEEEGLTEDELDDLVTTWGYVTTELGKDLAAEMKPSLRMYALLEEFPDWEAALVDTVEFLSTKHSTADVDRFLRNLNLSAKPDDRMQPGVFVDRLEKAGVIAWSDGWLITREGREFLDEYRSKKT